MRVVAGKPNNVGWRWLRSAVCEAARQGSIPEPTPIRVLIDPYGEGAGCNPADNVPQGSIPCRRTTSYASVAETE